MDPWTIFWLAVAIIIVWTFRGFIAVGIFALMVFCFGLLGLLGFGAFSWYEKINSKLHKRKYKL